MITVIVYSFSLDLEDDFVNFKILINAIIALKDEPIIPSMVINNEMLTSNLQMTSQTR